MKTINCRWIWPSWSNFGQSCVLPVLNGESSSPTCHSLWRYNLYKFSLLFSAGLLSGPPAIPHLEQHIRHRGRNDHLQGVSQHSPCHGHPNGPTGAKHQGGGRPLCLWDCVRAQQAAATWCSWKTINIRSHWGHFFSEVSRTSLFFQGFKVYHSIFALQQQHWEHWRDLCKACDTASSGEAKLISNENDNWYQHNFSGCHWCIRQDDDSAKVTETSPWAFCLLLFIISRLQVHQLWWPASSPDHECVLVGGPPVHRWRHHGQVILIIFIVLSLCHSVHSFVLLWHTWWCRKKINILPWISVSH